MAVAGSAFAIGEGRIQGKITDAATHKPIPNAVITIDAVSGHKVHNDYKADKDGVYRFIVLDGTLLYKVTISAPGYSPLEQQQVKFTLGDINTRDAVLAPAGSAPSGAKEAPAAKKPGAFVDDAGRYLGDHEGIAFYTPGQRRGLGIATGRRLYVQEVLPATNTVVLGPEESLRRSQCDVADLNLFDCSLLTGSTEVMVKVRYATPVTPATIQSLSGNTLRIVFHEPQRALSPGQSAVFYRNDHVLGGGIIQSF
jgi:hypothetical protein